MVSPSTLEQNASYPLPEELPEVIETVEARFREATAKHEALLDLPLSDYRERARGLGLVAGLTYVLTSPHSQHPNAIRVFREQYFTRRDMYDAEYHNPLDESNYGVSRQYIARVAAAMALMTMKSEDTYLQPVAKFAGLDRGGVNRTIIALEDHGYANAVDSQQRWRTPRLSYPTTKFAITLSSNPKWKREVRVQDAMRKMSAGRDEVEDRLLAKGYATFLNSPKHESEQ